jgi:SpoVK/Ycf46/Vps4 family AAA+-type ATPase
MKDFFQKLVDMSKNRQNAVVITGNTQDLIINKNLGIHTPMTFNYALCTFLADSNFQIGSINSTGFSHVVPPNGKNRSNPFPRATGDFLENPPIYISQFFDSLIKSNEDDLKTVLIINGIDLLLPESDKNTLSREQQAHIYISTELALSPSFKRSGNLFLYIALEGKVQESLFNSGAFSEINIPLPDYDQRFEFLEYMQNQDFFKCCFEKVGLELLAKSTAGLPLMFIERLLRDAANKKKYVSDRDVIEIKKDATCQLTGGHLEFIDSTKTLDDIVGLQQIKSHIQYEKALQDSKNYERMSSLEIWMGVPGVGKTYTVDAYANTQGWALYRWKDVRSKWVGESEKNMDKVTEFAEQQEQIMIFIDEADQIGGRSIGQNGDGGVDARIFGKFLEFTGDTKLRGKVKIILATNRVDLLDPAILDRTSEKYLFLPPNTNEKAELLELYLKKFGNAAEDIDFKEIARNKNLEFASTRDMIKIVNRAIKYSDLETKQFDSLVKTSHLIRAISEYNTGNTIEIEYIALLSLECLEFSDALLWIDEKGNYDEKLVPEFLKRIIEKDSGRINQISLQNRLNELKKIRLNSKLTR